MPSVDIHCKISADRTGNEFRELHKWIDAPRQHLGANHRIERHSFNSVYKNFIAKNFGGNRAVVEWLFHIALDNVHTANKFAFDEYNSAYDKITIFFKDKALHSCDCVKSGKEKKKRKSRRRFW